jgi:electron transport complex protein RnfD
MNNNTLPTSASTVTDNPNPQIFKSITIALIPAMIMSMIFFGHRSLLIMLTSVIACLLFDSLANRFLRKQKLYYWDNQAALTGILLAFCLPPGIPVWLVLPGALAAIGTSYITSGKLSAYRFNPALTGSLLLLICFPGQMSGWSATITSVESFTGATPLGMLSGGLKNGQTVTQIITSAGMPGYFDMFWGDVSGSLGETSTIAILIGGLYLFMKKIISWHIPVAVLGSMLLLEGILWMIVPGHFADPIFHLITGGAMLGAVFLATYPGTIPATTTGKIIFGTGVGLITLLIRNFGPYPEGMAIAILIMNGLTPVINSNSRLKLFAN